MKRRESLRVQIENMLDNGIVDAPRDQIRDDGWFECPYCLNRHDIDSILRHMRGHVNAWPQIRRALVGQLDYISHRYNDPATD